VHVLFLVIASLSQVFGSTSELGSLCDLSFKSKDQSKWISISCEEQTIRKKVVDVNTGALLDTQIYNFDQKISSNPKYATDFQIQSESETYSYDSRVLEVNTDKPGRLIIGMMDEDIDVRHPELAKFLLRNEKEVLDGLDNDGDGMIDDLYGLSFLSLDGLPNSVSHLIKISKDEDRPFSHGSHVGSILLNGHEDLSLATYTFPNESKYFYRISEYFTNVSRHMKKVKVRVMNMSLGTNMTLGGPPPIQAKNEQDYLQIRSSMEAFIESRPEVLFVVAAGNGFWGTAVNLDSTPHPTIPGALPHENILSVGAIDRAELSSDLESSKMTYFSNYGPQAVDILAPGQSVVGARLGGGSLPKNGTSMASPYVVNKVIVPLLRMNESFTNQDLIDLTLLTATIPNIEKPFPVKSGGIINPQRALHAAELLKANPDLRIEEAVTRVFDLEGWSLADIEKRKRLWRERDLVRPVLSAAR